MLLESEIAEEYPVRDKEILTPSGWKRVKTAYKTVPLPVWVLSTANRSIRCSGHHLVRSYRQAGDTDYRCHHVYSLIPGDWVETEDGAEKIEAVYNTGEEEELYDITIDSDDGLFYSNGIVSHNSTTLAARQLMLSHLIPRYSSLYIVPYHDQMKTYANRYQEMERAFRGGTDKQDKYVKKYGNGAMVEMNYALTDADKIRGKTVDECVCERALVRKNFCDKSLDTFSELRYIRPGDQVVCLDDNNQPHISYVKRYIPKGTRPCWTIQTESGYSVTCTANHRINTPAGWIYVADLIRDAADAASSRGVNLESACECDASGNAPRGRQHDPECNQDESPVQSESGRRAKRVYMGQIHAARQSGIQRRGKRTRKFRVWKAKRHSRHSSVRGTGSYIRIDIPGRQKESNAGVGRSINVGSRGVVVYGRRKHGQFLPEFSHGKLFPRGTRYSGRMVSRPGYSWRPTTNCTKIRRSSVQYFKRHGRKHLRYLAPHSSVHVANVCVQGGYTSYGLHAHLPDVRSAVCGRSAATRDGVTSQCSCMSDLHAGAYTATRSRMVQEEMGNGYRRGERRAQEKRKGILRQQPRSQRASKNRTCQVDGQEQGRIQRQTQVTESEDTRTAYTANSDLLHLRTNVRDEQSGVCCPEKPRDALLQKLPPAALQKHERKEVREVIVWNAGKPVPDKITRITYEGELPVADLAVEGHHNFFAGDISVHNCVIDECVDTQSLTTILREGGAPQFVKLGDVRPGDKIWTADPKTLECGYYTVTAYADKGVRPVFKLSAGHCTIKATANHRFLTELGTWVYLRDLKAGDRVYTYSSGQLRHSEISSIEPAGETRVADITVERVNSFIADGFLAHNCQNMDPELLPEILYTMTTSDLATTIYAGTALSIDTLLEAEWAKSSMGMWHVRAGDGKTWLNMYDKDVLSKVCDNPDGPRCPITKKLLNVTDGCYVHANQAAMDAGQIGVHVPQCIIPDFTNNPVQWNKIYKNICTQDFKKVMQECFGIAVAEGMREITESDLQKTCVIHESEEELRRRTINGYYRTVISGCDWGGSDYNPAAKTKTSYTVHCVIGLAPDGFVDILHWKKYSGMGYSTIADDIVKNHNYWNGRAIASDFGVGAVYNAELRKQIPFDRHFIMTYTGPNAAPLTETGGNLYNQLSLNRTEAISRVFKDIKSPHVLMIRSRPWGITSDYLIDFLNMYRAPVENNTGVTTFKYIRSATKTDDALHAFTFAYTLMALYKGEPIVQDLALEKRIRQVLSQSNSQSTNEFRNSSFMSIPPVISG